MSYLRTLEETSGPRYRPGRSRKIAIFCFLPRSSSRYPDKKWNETKFFFGVKAAGMTTSLERTQTHWHGPPWPYFGHFLFKGHGQIDIKQPLHSRASSTPYSSSFEKGSIAIQSLIKYRPSLLKISCEFAFPSGSELFVASCCTEFRTGSPLPCDRYAFDASVCSHS